MATIRTPSEFSEILDTNADFSVSDTVTVLAEFAAKVTNKMTIISTPRSSGKSLFSEYAKELENTTGRH